MHLPTELGQNRRKVGLLKRCMYGTRDAGSIWEFTYTAALLQMGFEQCRSSPCCFLHPSRGIAIVIHGDDFTSLGTDEDLDWYETELQRYFEVELRGRLGTGSKDLQEIKILNRVVRLDARGLAYEADPRHVELLVKSLGLDGCRRVSSPGSKDKCPELMADGLLPNEDEASTNELCAAVTKGVQRTPNRKGHNVNFKMPPEVFKVPAYSSLFKMHPRHFVLSGPIGQTSFRRIPRDSCSFTGLSQEELDERKREVLGEQRDRASSRRESILHMVLTQGNPWEVSTDMLIAAVCKTKFKKRVGAKAAKNVELLENPGEVLNAAEATGFRALAARANYLALDRPDVAYAAKELCREFSRPTALAVVKLKRLVRYLHHHARLVWRYDYEEPSVAMDTFVDTDFAGCWRTRRSTSGGIALLGSHILRHWSMTQSTVALSSAEAELTGICKGSSIALGLSALCKDLGLTVKTRIHSDASAAIGIARRRGLGKVRHLATADLWIQDKVRTGEIELLKVKGSENPADILTKHIEGNVLNLHLMRLRLELEGGRAASAAAISSEVVSALTFQYGSIRSAHKRLHRYCKDVQCVCQLRAMAAASTVDAKPGQEPRARELTLHSGKHGQVDECKTPRKAEEKKASMSPRGEKCPTVPGEKRAAFSSGGPAGPALKGAVEDMPKSSGIQEIVGGSKGVANHRVHSACPNRPVKDARVCNFSTTMRTSAATSAATRRDLSHPTCCRK